MPEEAASVVGKENPFKRQKSGQGGSSPDSKKDGEKGGDSSGSSQDTNNKREVVDKELYDILEVPTDASQEEIRRQYYKLARKFHPDKNRDDPEAKVKFQKLGEAYQVLGDEDRRLQYDQYGSSAAQDMPIIDSSLFFMMLFGSEELEPYIGKLKMAMFVEMVDKDAKVKAASTGKRRGKKMMIQREKKGEEQRDIWTEDR